MNRLTRSRCARSGDSRDLRRRRFLVTALHATAGALVAGKSSAQEQGKGEKKGSDKKVRGKDKENEIRIDGTIRQVAPQGLVVDGADGNKYLIGATGDSQVTLEGAADAAFLAPGAYLEFEADLDRNGLPNKPIGEVTFIAASNLNPPGLFPFSVTDENAPSGGTTAAAYLVRGKLVAHRDKKLSVQTGRKIVVAELDEIVALHARFDGWKLAAAGDSIRANVELLPQINTGLTRVVARKATIRAADPIRPTGSKRT